ncbi:MAG: hypothetical protein NC302_02610 [Bacteroidales bacterium]|nr:hypothetical protein [Bacteroidales bacterium]MCM1416559.1 hypothetical protein [bacterium]MCM1423101.1 hypothetical protein [bacterium]
MNKFQKWLTAVAASILAILVLTAALVIWIDPFFHYHAPLSGFPYLVDNQLSQNPGMAKHMEYDSVMLGSSMTVNFNMDWFRELLYRNTIKLSYSGAYPKDQANIMDVIFASGHEVKEVFLGVDVTTYTGGVDETKYPIPAYLYDDSYLNDVQYLLNKDVLLNYILRPIADPDKTDLATVYQSWWTDEYYNIQWVMHNYVPSEKVEAEMPADALIESTERNLRANLCPYIEENPDTVFTIFFPPYSILYWNDVMQENRLEATMREYAHIAETLLSYDNVRVFYFPNREEIVTDLNNYADYTHYHARFNRFMTECFADGTCEIRSMEEMERALDETREMIAEFDFETLFSVAY